jgi:hypothetical protein
MMTSTDVLMSDARISPQRVDFIRQLLLRVWRLKGANKLFNAALAYAPYPFSYWIERERARVRRVELAARIRDRPRLVPVSALRTVLLDGLNLLADRHGRAALGDYLEFGVYNGTSLLCTYRACEEAGLTHVRLFGFDSFQRGRRPVGARPLLLSTGVHTRRSRRREHRLEPRHARARLVPGYLERSHP